MDCSEITSAIVAAICGKQAIGGTGSEFIILNYNDIDRELSTVVDNVITEIVLKDAKKGFKFTTLEDSVVGDFAMNKGTYFSNFSHNVPLKIFVKSEKAKNFINNGIGSRIIVIVPNKEIGTAGVGDTAKTGEVKYEVYGWDSGLEALELTGTTDIADGVVYDVKFGSGDKSKENSIPKSFFNTDLTTTETALAALTAA